MKQIIKKYQKISIEMLKKIDFLKIMYISITRLKDIH